MPTFTLYDRPDCPYSKRVRRVLEVLGVDHKDGIVPEANADHDDLNQSPANAASQCSSATTSQRAIWMIAPRPRRISRNTITDDA